METMAWMECGTPEPGSLAEGGLQSTTTRNSERARGRVGDGLSPACTTAIQS